MSKMFFEVCHTKEDIIKAYQKYLSMKKFKLSFSECVFQKKYQEKWQENNSSYQKKSFS